MKYYNDMGVDVTHNIRQIEANLLDALNEGIELKKINVEQRENLEKRAKTIKRLRRQLKEKEETIKKCQNHTKKKTDQTGEDSPLEQVE